MTGQDWPADLVEQVACAMHAEYYARLRAGSSWVVMTTNARHPWRLRARAALSALPPGAQAVLRGEAVAVPVSPDWPRPHPVLETYHSGQRFVAVGYWVPADRLNAMLAASPYAQEPR